MQLTGAYDDLNIAVKCMDSEIPYASLEYKIITRDNNNELPSYETVDRIGGYINSILPAFSDHEHANVRRHGFDANAYYEEDLQKQSSGITEHLNKDVVLLKMQETNKMSN